ncbi:hypothetical protein ACVXZY_07445 [Staphylococcus aureus]
MILSVSLCAQTNSENKETKVLNEIRQKCDVDELSIEHDLAILMIVGEGMNKVIGTARKLHMP